MNTLADGLVLVVKEQCPTCDLIQPVALQLAERDPAFSVFSQDNPGFPSGIRVIDDRELEHSYRLGIEIVPTLVRIEAGREANRAVGWHREEWEKLTGLSGLGVGLADQKPGCGSLSVEPGMEELLQVRFGETPMQSRRLEVPASEDSIETCYARGWSDGLPLVPPTEVRVLRMLGGTTRSADEILGTVPPALASCTVEKVAINAVMAGCRAEYLPVVLAAVEAALEPAFCLHGVLATTDFVGPIVIVNGPVTRRIGMNCGVNALGQGNRANATIGRALQLIVRNLGGGKPGGVDRSTLGQPGKYSFCFAEDESDDDWQPLCVERGFSQGSSTVTLFAGAAPRGVWDEDSRTPELLSKTLTGDILESEAPGSVLVLSPEHYAIFREASWSRERIHASMLEELRCRPEDLLIVRAGGPAGLVSAFMPAWGAIGEAGSAPVTKEITT